MTHVQVPKDSRVAKALLRNQANAEASHWEGALPAHTPFTHPNMQEFTPPENVMTGDRPSSHSDDDMRTNALYQNQQHPNPQQVRTSMHPADCIHDVCCRSSTIEIQAIYKSPHMCIPFFFEMVTINAPIFCNRRTWIYTAVIGSAKASPALKPARRKNE